MSQLSRTQLVCSPALTNKCVCVFQLQEGTKHQNGYVKWTMAHHQHCPKNPPKKTSALHFAMVSFSAMSSTKSTLALFSRLYIYIYIHTPTFVSCPCFIASKTVLNNLHVFKSYNKLIKNLNNSPRWAFLSNHFFLHVNFDMHARNSKCFLRRKTA